MSSPERDRSTPDASTEASGRSMRRWIIGLAAALFFGFVIYQVINPFPNQPYMEIPHGDHTHYVPKDRNPDVSISQFPTQPPGPNERIMPDGRVVQTQ